MNLILLCDGTWNDPTDDFKTNIWRLSKLIPQTAWQKVYYQAGVGNKTEGNIWSQFWGGISGWGVEKKVDEALRWLRDSYRTEDKGFIIGFSRGAATARLVAARAGIPIEFLGCFDTVGAFGIPMDIGPFKFQSINLFKDMHVSRAVKKAYHIVAINEQRNAFKPTLMNARRGIQEEWLYGIHADIGGGFEEDGLATIALESMIKHAIKSGLEMKVPPLLIRPAVVHKNKKLPGNATRQNFIQINDQLSKIPGNLHPYVK